MAEKNLYILHGQVFIMLQNHHPIMYEVSYSTEDGIQKNLIYRGLDYSFAFKLPAGRQDNDHQGK